MKTILVKIIIILLFIPLVIFANGEKINYKKTKTINKEYDVNENALLKINNRYGNVDITSWNENRIVFEIIITVKGNDKEMVEDKLDAITVDFDSSPYEVSAKTIINKNKPKGWFSWFGSYKLNINYKINYKIKMPINNDLTVYNDYGSIYLNELDGKATINCDYGKIVIGSLNNTENSINTDYSRNSTIEFINSGKINADYSSFTIEAAKNIDLNADYTTSKIENIENLNFNCDYGSLYVDKANFVSGDGNYLSMTFGKIYKKINIDADYGSIRIAALQNNFKSVKINSDYTGIKIGVNSSANFNITAKLSYGKFSTEGDFNFNKKIVKSSSKYYEGYHKNKNSNSIINITTDYGSVKLFEY
ncbi:MAG: hypothetical protein L3J23_00980 [Flavobacteriaceae bacterium]|nr:hypothetical protein [Flavobacteriaceae bacterium]